jgi:hypothetical protein
VRALFATSILATAMFIAPRDAAATVGGPKVIEVLGYAPIDRKVYFLEHREDSSDALPQLFFVRVDGPHAGDPIAAQSWRARDDDDEEEARARFDRRLARLRSHLRPLRATTGRWELRTEVTRQGTWDGEPFGFASRDEFHVRCELEDRDASQSASPVTVTTYDTDAVEIVAEFAVPAGEVSFVVLRYLGQPWELGYEVDTPVLARPM